MNWITPQLAIANHIDVQNHDLLLREKIKSIISLDGKKRTFPSTIEEHEVFNFIDGSGNSMQLFTRVIDILADFVDNYSPVIVHCHAGRSRSASVVIGYYIKYHDMQVEEAIDFVGQKRQINIADGLLRLLYSL